MGYNTTYNLKWQSIGKDPTAPNCEHAEAVNQKFCPNCGVRTGIKGLPEMIKDYLTLHRDDYYGISLDGSANDCCKWYEHEDAMRTMSKHFAEVVFSLSGEGEESGDIWTKYFLNGKMQIEKAEVRVAPFDKSKLK